MLDREAAVAWYRKNRERSRMLFDLVADEAYYSRPIALRHPIVFYEGHLPAFSFNTLVKKGLGGGSIDPRLEALFARGIDPHESQGGFGPPKGGHYRGVRAANDERSRWPSQDVVRAFAAEADARVIDALASGDVEQPGHPLLDRAEAVFTILEHEAMHHETMLYMWHRLPFEQKRRPAGYTPCTDGRVPPSEWIDVPGGGASLGVDRRTVRFGWDNEFPACRADVPPFSIERHNVTNAQFLEFVEAGGYGDERWWSRADWEWVQRERLSHPLFWERATGRPEGLRYNHNGHDGTWFWRGMFELIPLPLSWPVYVSQAEAAAYARWRGARLPTEAEYQRAACGSPDGDRVPQRGSRVGDLERRHPWGSASPSPEYGVFDLSTWDPEPAGSHPRGASAWGVEDLVGNGWEWTSTPFAPFPGFRAMASYPEYSADFFDGEHVVMKGASPATAAELLRPTLRNWFRARYPYVYATFRSVKNSVGRA